jgi:hypothetical protein
VKYQTGDTLIVVENIEVLTLTASSLTNAVNYVFTVEARNSFGYSSPSDQLFLYCGFISEKPLSVATNVVTNTVVISWTAPYDNGATIDSYTIYI